MWNFKIDLAGELVVFLEHRTPPPFHEFGPHFSHEDERRVVKLADLEELPCEGQLQKSSDTAGNDDESVRHDHEMMQSRKKGPMFVRLADERVHFLFEWQRDTDTDRTLESLGMNGGRPFAWHLP